MGSGVKTSCIKFDYVKAILYMAELAAKSIIHYLEIIAIEIEKKVKIPKQKSNNQSFAPIILAKLTVLLKFEAKN